jgi:hypothetical protein
MQVSFSYENSQILIQGIPRFGAAAPGALDFLSTNPQVWMCIKYLKLSDVFLCNEFNSLLVEMALIWTSI